MIIVSCTNQEHCYCRHNEHLPLQENLQVLMPGCIIHLIDHLVDSANICRHTSKDPVFSKVYQAVWSTGCFIQIEHELSIENGCLLWGSQVIIPHILRQVLKELYQCHSGMVKMKDLVQIYVWWPGMDVDIRKKLTVVIHTKALELLSQGYHYIPGNGPKNPGTRSMLITTAEICS